jgi:hypothetical protein
LAEHSTSDQVSSYYPGYQNPKKGVPENEGGFKEHHHHQHYKQQDVLTRKKEGDQPEEKKEEYKHKKHYQPKTSSANDEPWVHPPGLKNDTEEEAFPQGRFHKGKVREM